MFDKNRQFGATENVVSTKSHTDIRLGFLPRTSRPGSGLLPPYPTFVTDPPPPPRLCGTPQSHSCKPIVEGLAWRLYNTEGCLKNTPLSPSPLGRPGIRGGARKHLQGKWLMRRPVGAFARAPILLHKNRDFRERLRRVGDRTGLP